MPASSTPPAIAVTHFAGRVGDRNDRAMAASPRLAAALSTRFDVSAAVFTAIRAQ